MIIYKIKNVSFLSILEITSEKETIVEIKTFVEVSDNVNKAAKREGVVLVLEHVNMISTSPFRYVLSLSKFIFLYGSSSLAGCDSYSIQYFSMYFNTLNSAYG